jgi:hypothetical protein
MIGGVYGGKGDEKKATARKRGGTVKCRLWDLKIVKCLESGAS